MPVGTMRICRHKASSRMVHWHCDTHLGKPRESSWQPRDTKKKFACATQERQSVEPNPGGRCDKSAARCRALVAEWRWRPGGGGGGDDGASSSRLPRVCVYLTQQDRSGRQAGSLTRMYYSVLRTSYGYFVRVTT